MLPARLRCTRGTTHSGGIPCRNVMVEALPREAPSGRSITTIRPRSTGPRTAGFVRFDPLANCARNCARPLRKFYKLLKISGLHVCHCVRCGLPALAVKPCSSGRKRGERRRRIQFHAAIDAWIVSDPTRTIIPVRRSPSMESEVRHVQHRIPSGIVLGDRRPGPVVVAPPRVEEVAHGADALHRRSCTG